jgi:hypothetical protein
MVLPGGFADRAGNMYIYAQINKHEISLALLYASRN